MTRKATSKYLRHPQGGLEIDGMKTESALEASTENEEEVWGESERAAAEHMSLPIQKGFHCFVLPAGHAPQFTTQQTPAHLHPSDARIINHTSFDTWNHWSAGSLSTW